MAVIVTPWSERQHTRMLAPMYMEPRKLSVSVAVPPAPVRVPSQRPIAPSFTSDVDKARTVHLALVYTRKDYVNLEIKWFIYRTYS